MALAGLFAVPAAAQTAGVELFTSQGCSSCPPADANLIRLMDQIDVLALSFGVTYWNYLGLGRYLRETGIHRPAIRL